MSKETDIVLLGGAGDVGLRLARILLERTAAVVTTVSRRAGVDSDRHGDRHGDRRRHISFDLSGAEPLKITAGAIVVNLTEATQPKLVSQVIKGGGRFLETSATPDYLRGLMAAAEATTGPGAAIFCVGVAPGLTNLMAAKIATAAPDTRQIDIGLEMGMGRHYGMAATTWFLQTAGAPYQVVIGHSARGVMPGALTRKFALRQDGVLRPAIGYGFAEQVLIAERSNKALKTVRSFVALDPPWMTRSLAWMLRLGFGPAMSRHATKLAKWLLRLPAFGATYTRILGEGFDDADHLTGQIRVETGDQAEATAAMIFATIQSLLAREKPVKTGVTLISDHLHFDAAALTLQRLLPQTTISGNIGESQ
uniref:hypothetical protein n=1 Tax=Yoonia sp. TaxID=2212373 RepID=UPI004047560C